MVTILIVDDEPGQRELLESLLRRHGFGTVCAASGAEALDQVRQSVPDLIVSDVRMPGMSGLELLRAVREIAATVPFLVVTAYADLRDAVSAIREGAVDYLEKPLDFQEVLSCIGRALGLDESPHEPPGDLPALPAGVIAESPAMRNVLCDAALVAPTDSRVLLTGESGTGKEVVADLIHTWSKRSNGPNIKVNCAAIPENLLESEVFGHEKGAFTGATQQRIGRFEEADGGTLFLDEIGDLSPALQAKLLRVIQDGTFERVGSNQPRVADVRIVAATNRNLYADIETGRFREDLFYRLNVIELYLPPLRERPEDILSLATCFAARFAHGRSRFSPTTARLLAMYTWPGNVRELQNAMERAVLMSRGGVVMPEHLPRRVREEVEADAGTLSAAGDTSTNRVEDVERAVILQSLREHDYNRSETARALGISRRGLIYKLRRYEGLGIDVNPPKDDSPEKRQP
jgi:DNA-binding NtrC family response regulator